jgi:hypothetical protein
MTTRLSINDHPHQNQAPVYGAADGRVPWSGVSPEACDLI